MTIDFEHIPKQNNVYYLTTENTKFSKIYLEVREKENRVLSDDEVKKLPYLDRNEWAYRIKSTERFTDYIKQKNTGLHIATVGCGNGWFSNKIAEVSPNNKVIGVDINKMELEQGARVFTKPNIYFAFVDIFQASAFFEKKLDIIVLNGAVQYFKDLKKMITLLKSFLKPKGEIHIVDSPFYSASTISKAKERTKAYYSELGFPEMANLYYHHDINQISDFEVLYTYHRNIINKLLGKKDSPFSWYRFSNSI